MKFNPQIHHRLSTRLKGYDYTLAGAYFVTICTRQRACLFGEVVEGEMRLSAAGKIVQWEWMRLGERFPAIRLDAFLVMPNHVHGIIMINVTVGATQADQTRFISASEIQSILDLSGTDGSPLRRPGGPPPQSLGAIIAQWKSRVTKRIWKLPGMKGKPI